MTDYNADGKVALSASSSNSHAGDLVISEITNLESLRVRLQEQCAKAAGERIRLPIDAYFFIVPDTGGSVEMDFVIGDLDLIFSEYARELNLDALACFDENKENAEIALGEIIQRYVHNQ